MNPFIGEIRIFAGNFAPRDWSFCDGSLLAIANNTALYSLIGTTYGGDGQNTFALPNLMSRIAIGQGSGPGLSNYALGQQGGTENVTLDGKQLPQHTHFLSALTTPATSMSPANALLAAVPSAEFLYLAPTAPSPVSSPPAAAAISAAGGSQPHSNIMPCLGINYIISLYGIFPSQN